MSKRNKKRSAIKKKHRRMKYYGLSVGSQVTYNGQSLLVKQLLKNDQVLLSDGSIALAKQVK